MAISIIHYSKIKDNYCIAYFGHTKEYLLQLNYLRSQIEEKYPNLKLFICCRDEYVDFLPKNDQIFSRTNLKNYKKNLAHIFELECNFQEHPIEKIVKECNLEIKPVEILPNPSKNCAFFPTGLFPTKSCPNVQDIKNKITNLGYNICFDNPGLVVGVENDNFYQLALAGVPSILLDTGIGTNFYKKLVSTPIIWQTTS